MSNRRNNDFFEQLRKMVEEMMASSGIDFEEIQEKLESGEPFQFGYSLQFDPSGKPVFNSFSNDQPPQPTRGEGEGRSGEVEEPFTDVIMDPAENLIRVIVELPGVDKKDLTVRSRDTKLVVKASNDRKKYKKEVELPEFQPESVRAKLRNGILELLINPTQPLTDEEEDEGTPISVD